MNKGIMRIALIGAGVAALYYKDELASWFGGSTAAPQQQQPQQQPPAQQTQQPPAWQQPAPAWQQPAQQQPPVQQQPAPAPVPLPASAVPITDDLIRRATWDDAAAAQLGDRILYNIHEWNWFYDYSDGSEGGSRPNPGTDFSHVGIDPNAKISASAYRQIRKSAGFAGLAGLVRIGRANRAVRGPRH